jgi:hypothetical protein
VPVATAPQCRGAAEVEPPAIVRVTTDVLVLDIDLKGGTLVSPSCRLSVVKGEAATVVCSTATRSH